MPDQSSAASEHALIQEITVPLQALPDDPMAIVAADFPTAMRGYDRHAVDDYVAQVSDLVAELHATRSPEAAVRQALERVGDQISGILQRAHETAEQITTQSRAEAEDRLEQARREAATMVDAAAQRVRELDDDADRIWAERQRIIDDTEDLAGQLRTVAQEATARFAPVEEGRAPAVDHDAGEPPAVAETPEVADEPVAAGASELGAAPLALEETPADASARDLDGPDGDVGEVAGELGEVAGELDEPAGELDEIEATRPFTPVQITDEDSTQIIPPSSDAARHRRDG